MARVTAEQELRRALSRRELELAYQPIVEMGDGRIVSVEALARWQHPERGLVAAGEFVPMAEDLCLAAELGQWVLRQASADVGMLRRRGAWPHGARMNVNISAHQIGPELIEQVAAAVRLAGIDFEDITLEITESVLADRLTDATDVLSDLRKLGCLVALDDFGTGYSSPGYLAQLPVDVLKIDRTFVAEAGTSPRLLTLTRMTVGLGRALQLTCVAEGVESEQQSKSLTQLGCVTAQGFLYHRPLTVHGLQSVLTAQAAVIHLTEKPARIDR